MIMIAQGSNHQQQHQLEMTSSTIHQQEHHTSPILSKTQSIHTYIYI